MLVTGIERDGTMEGPDVDLLDAVGAGAPGVGLIASGGVGSVGDIVRLRGLEVPLEAVIVGRALYEGRFTLREAIAAAQA
jgi:phosphoribosylanthranilate isomerase